MIQRDITQQNTGKGNEKGTNKENTNQWTRQFVNELLPLHYISYKSNRLGSKNPRKFTNIPSTSPNPNISPQTSKET